jgi:hypothetical protein
MSTSQRATYHSDLESNGLCRNGKAWLWPSEMSAGGAVSPSASVPPVGGHIWSLALQLSATHSGPRNSINLEAQPPFSLPFFSFAPVLLLSRNSLGTVVSLGATFLNAIADSGSLLSLTTSTALLCRSTAESIDSIGIEIGASPAAFTSITSECLIAQDVLEKLKLFLNSNPSTPDYGDIRNCLDQVVQALNSVLFEADIELRRLRRYATEESHQSELKLVPMVQDSLFETRRNLRLNRSSLSLLLDCIHR